MPLIKFNGVYRHTQSVASTTWSITHNLDTPSPVVDVWILQGSPAVYTKVIPQNVSYPDNNSVTITFSTAQTGRAIIG